MVYKDGHLGSSGYRVKEEGLGKTMKNLNFHGWSIGEKIWQERQNEFHAWCKTRWMWG